LIDIKILYGRLLLITLVFLVHLSHSQIFLNEDFSTGEMPPAGWQIEVAPDQWTANSSANAGGAAPEARFQWVNEVGTSKLISPPIDLSGLNKVNFQFDHFYDDYEGDGPSVGVATRSGNGVWTSVWHITPEQNIGPETVSLEISNDDVGQPDFQICCYVQGNFFNLDYWYIDNIKLFFPNELDITILLEGPYTNGMMTNELITEGLFPLEQPFDKAPWNYEGEESLPSIPSENFTDWILIQLLKENQYLPGKFEIAYSKAGLLTAGGKVRSLDGVSNLSFPFAGTEELYVWVHHRNHLSVLSAEPISMSKETFVLDFSSDTGLVLLPEHSLKELTPGVWGIKSGDGNADGQINNQDKNDSLVQLQNLTGYLSNDYNLDGEISIEDLEGFWLENAGSGHFVPDTSEVPFVCGEYFMDYRDQKMYATVQIGDQCWMKENLNYETGTSWCYYNSEAYCNVYGRLYDWNTIMNGAPGTNTVPSGVQGICPEGWHIPSDGGWCILNQYADASFVCDTTGYNGTDGGYKLKSTSGWSSGGNGSDEYGFTALPGGSMGIYHFDDLYLFAYFWTATEDYPGYAWLYKINYGLPTVGRYFSAKNRGYSVRCVKD